MEAEKLVYCSSSGERGWRVESRYYLFLTYLFIFGCMWAFSCCSKQRLLVVVGYGLLTAMASLVGEHKL